MNLPSYRLLVHRRQHRFPPHTAASPAEWSTSSMSRHAGPGRTAGRCTDGRVLPTTHTCAVRPIGARRDLTSWNIPLLMPYSRVGGGRVTDSVELHRPVSRRRAADPVVPAEHVRWVDLRSARLDHQARCEPEGKGQRGGRGDGASPWATAWSGKAKGTQRSRPGYPRRPQWSTCQR